MDSHDLDGKVRTGGVRGLWLALALACAPLGVLRAAEPAEPVEARLEAVHYAARRLQASGIEYDLSSTAIYELANGPRLTLKDLKPGMSVRLVLVPDPAVSVVTRVVVLAN